MSEKDGGAVRRESCMDAFRGAIDSCELRDLGYKGCIFTWQRGNHVDTFVRERLDRFLGDDGWCNLFPNFSVQHLARVTSDHTPIFLDTINYYERGRKGKIFRFEALWLSKEDCSEVVSKAWCDGEGSEPHKRIALCAEYLTKWAATSFGEIKKKIRNKECELQEA
ncbi:uncharacterized protein LOC110729440 [Chenopodium quinoa]|uniref:uncharacterized protein LOC110729440 n=1 Tax=Chenopodium quinoa TaxID=63459 RepID=UPI000B77EF79|nr:uncharacterized protein LOC110729440 [Chenopodium quinoa]